MTLTAEQRLRLRRDFLADLVEVFPEWGSPVLATSAAAGDLTLDLTGLAATGTLARGIQFDLITLIRADRYAVAADADISELVPNTATITISPILAAPASSGDSVRVQPRKWGVYNQQTGSQLWTDDELDQYADEAERKWGRRIHTGDRMETLLLEGATVVALNALTNPMSGAGYRLLNADLRGTGQFSGEQFEKRIAGFLADLEVDSKGMRIIPALL